MSSRSPNGSAAASPGTWPSPPAPPAPTSWTSTSTAPPETATPPSPRSSAPAWSTARQPTCGPRPAGCTPTSPAPDQHNGRLPSHHLDFRSQGGYILAPPSQVGGKPYRLIKKLGGHGGLDWAAVTRLLEPQRHQQRPAPGQDPDRDARPAGPLGRQPARRQPQLRPVLGRQPRPGRRPRRRPEPPGRRRPPGRPRRTGDHPHPRLRPQGTRAATTRPRR